MRKDVYGIWLPIENVPQKLFPIQRGLLLDFGPVDLRSKDISLVIVRASPAESTAESSHCLLPGHCEGVQRLKQSQTLNHEIASLRSR